MAYGDVLRTTDGIGSQNLTRVGGLRLRRSQRSCDFCRQRKIRCDGPQTADSRCSNCLAFDSACTYEKPARKRGPKNISMEELRKENASLKAKLRSLSLCSLCSQPLQSLPTRRDGRSVNASVFRHSSPESDTSSDTQEPPDEQDFISDELAVRFSQFTLHCMQDKDFGSASSFALANKAIAMKEKHEGRPLLPILRRPLFWDILPWEKKELDKLPLYFYPAGDLIDSLLSLYFTNVHPTMPILHRPTFERSVAEGLHLTDIDFGGLLLSVLAVASRYSNDQRVFVDGDSSLSAGWKFANAIQILRKKAGEPSIYEVQMYFFLTIFVLGTSMPQVSWLYIGVGIRFLQQSGRHRRKPEGHKPNLRDELWKRAFWSYLVLEALVCLFLGRPTGLQVEEYDLELPLEVDDEYWDSGFIQPLGKPSQLSYFVCQLRLSEILVDAMRRLYGSKKSKILLGWDGPEWEQRVVAELDSAMNDFHDSIPLHLRWDPEDPPQGTFFDQSAILHISYNHVLIAIHRLHLQKATKHGGAPSLFICARAARAVIRTADIWLSKLQCIPLPNLINPVFLSGLVLVLYMVGTTRAGLPMDSQHRDLVHIATALDILKFAESRSQSVGRLWEVLRELWSLDGSLPPKYRSNYAPDSGDAGASDPATSGPVSAATVPVEYHGQLGQSFDLWNGTTGSSDRSPVVKPGMTIEQLLADAATMESVLEVDDELMSIWMAAPTDVSNFSDWSAYLQNRNMSGDGLTFDIFGNGEG
ncbi:Fungal-trans domain-containing protein [Mycena venus]|uniref:Fungal-trans domain-containing protein n=1 Tax=Mycena venus TaxID=2733690 RepID=A0A8H7CM57_9AGAR|nr:Fungal-trans domain-containing protein [Mycena venus]